MPAVRLHEFRKGKQMGIYIISPQPPETPIPTKHFHPPYERTAAPIQIEPADDNPAFKVGRTISMDKRLNSYYICWNEGFYIYRALLLNDTYGRYTMEEKRASLKKTFEIQNYLF